MDVDPTQAALASVLVTLLAVEFGAVALAVGAVTGSRAVAVATTGGLAVAAYLLYLVGQLVESVRPYRWLSPIYQAIVDGPIGPTAPGIAVIMPLVAVVAVAVAVPVFDRRDLTG
jgi:ABC-2 type transport system permease protein